MVTDAIVRVGAWFLNWLLGLLPTWQWPSGFNAPSPSAFQGVGLPIDRVIDISLAVQIVLAVLATAVVAAAVKVVRILISHVTGGGGMA